MTEHTPGSLDGEPEEPQQKAESPAPVAPGETPLAGVPSPSEQQHPQNADPLVPQPNEDAGAQFARQTVEQPQAAEQAQYPGHYPYQPYPQSQQWQPGYPPSMGTVRQVPSAGSGISGRLIAGVVALVVLTGLIGGGVGGYIGYKVGDDTSRSAPSALDQPRPARSTSTAPPGSVTQVAQKVLPSVVQLQTQSAQGAGEGSGIVLSSDGYILTNNHVADAAGQGRMTALFHDNRMANVRVVGADPNSDLAVVKADNVDGLTPAELGRSDDLPVGAPVVAIGSPFGLSDTVTSGIISAKDRPVRAGGENGNQASVLNALQTDAAINPGNSGGPLVDMDGRVVGINSAIYSPGSGQEQAGSVGLGFAIPIDQAQRTANELKKTGSATEATLGVQITNTNTPGALVAQVVPGGAAEKAGIRNGEVITRLDNRVIRDPDTLVAAVRSHAPGDRVTITATGPGAAPEHTSEVILGGKKS
jgi:putative serine protease PepD